MEETKEAPRRRRRKPAAEVHDAAEVPDWDEARIQEAKEVGASAVEARGIVMTALRGGDWQLAKSGSIVYGIFIDKANILTNKGPAVKKASRQDRDQLMKKAEQLRERAKRKPQPADAADG